MCQPVSQRREGCTRTHATAETNEQTCQADTAPRQCSPHAHSVIDTQVTQQATDKGPKQHSTYQ